MNIRSCYFIKLNGKCIYAAGGKVSEEKVHSSLLLLTIHAVAAVVLHCALHCDLLMEDLWIELHYP